MTRLIPLSTIKSEAAARGFHVREMVTSYDDDAFTVLEIDAPGFENGGGWHGGCQYSGAQFIIKDRGEYGHNACFKGPWHRGLVQADSYGLRELMAHPLMAKS